MPTTLQGYGPFAIFGALLLVVGLVALGASMFLGPKKPGKVKAEPWECGVDLLQPTARDRFAVPFYLVAIFFILFDLETVFLFPWAVVMKRVVHENPGAGLQLFAEVTAFVLILATGLFYVWKRRALEWD